MKKGKIQKDILILSILSFLTVLTWIVLDVYRALTKTKIPKVLKEQITPLNPSIDSDLLIELKSRKTVSPEEFLSLKQEKEETKTEEATQEAEQEPETELTDIQATLEEE